MVYCDELDIEIPIGWEHLSIEEIASLKYGKMLDSNKFLNRGYPVFSGYGIRGYYSSYMYDEPQILVLCRGVSGTGEVRMSPKKAYITNLSIVVEINLIKMSKYFLFYYLKNKNLGTLDSGSAQSQITIGDLNQVLVLNSSSIIQNKFEEYINSIELNINTNKKSTQLLINMKEILLSKIATIKDIK
jgi:type I restriction enzyme S subunit